MEPVDSGPGKESLDSSTSSKGRQRKKNSKYLDYETDYELGAEGLARKRRRESSGGGRASPKKTPARSRKTKKASQQTASEEKEASDKTTQVSDDQTSEETPKKTPRGRKTPSKKTPARKTPAATVVATAAGGAVGVQQENGTSQPKRKYVRKQLNQDAAAMSEPPCEDAQGQPPVLAEEEAEGGGRPRRGAAKAALKYLHILAKEMLDHKSEESSSQPGSNSEVGGSQQKTARRKEATKGQKRKRPDFDSDAPEDDDFVPGVEEEEEELDQTEDEDAAESSDLDSDFGRSPAAFRVQKIGSLNNCKEKNGLAVNVMKVVWEFIETTKKFREEHYSSWVFADWVPSTSAWHRVAQSDLDKYLPEELHSASFKVTREGLGKEETPLQRLDRFGSVPFHPERWDALLFAGGPVWAMEWCPTPDGVPATQYVALSCHRGMDDWHYVNRTYTGPGLVQLWDVGQLEYGTRPHSQPSLAYALAQDRGFIWQLKWCPAGGWELPSCGRKAPFLPRLGLLAVATSDGVVTIYSLPHPDALHSSYQLSDSEISSQPLPVYKAAGVVTLKLGAFKTPRLERSGQVLSMDWLPEKPHNIMAIGFYDGTVGLWNLSSTSSLLRIRESDASLSLLPYRCLLAHDHAVRALAFCPASRHLLVTAGEDRYVKTWDLRRPYDPITVQKRYLTSEVAWPLNGPGVLVAQDCAYAPRGLHGVHYLNHGFNSYFAIPRTGTTWSLSYTDWMNSVVVCDSFGDVIVALLPQINCFPLYVKRTIERRFPVYLTSVLPYDTPEDGQTSGAVDEDAEAQRGGAMDDSHAQSDEGNKNVNGNETEGEQGGEREQPSHQFETYKEAVKKWCLHQTDFDIRSFVKLEKRALWQRMKNSEIKRKLNPDEMPIAGLHKVRFNPNLNCHVWVVSGGQTGLVRLNCLRGMISPQSKKIVSDSQTQSKAQDASSEPPPTL